MLMRKFKLDISTSLDGALVEMIQQQRNDISKQRSKAMLMLNIDLDRCMKMDGAVIKII